MKINPPYFDHYFRLGRSTFSKEERYTPFLFVAYFCGAWYHKENFEKR